MQTNGKNNRAAKFGQITGSCTFAIRVDIEPPRKAKMYNRKNYTNLTSGRKNLCEKLCELKIVRIFVLTILLNKFVSNEKHSGRKDKAGQSATGKTN